MASLPVMGLLANNHLGERGLFAYLSSSLVLRKNYVPFVSSSEDGITEAGKRFGRMLAACRIEAIEISLTNTAYARQSWYGDCNLRITSVTGVGASPLQFK
jgi:hypothetical protein